MTQKPLSNETLRDVLGDEERDAQLHNSNVRGRKKESRGGARGPLPMGGGQIGGPAPSAQTPMAPASNPMAAGPNLPMAAPQAAVVTGASAAGMAEVEASVQFDGGQLQADGVDGSTDPWGAYDNPDNVPGLSLDDEFDGEHEDAAVLALRGSGTRGGSKQQGSRMAPMVPMAGAGAAGAPGGAMAAGAGVPGGIAGAGMNPALTVPAATVGGVGGSSMMVAQQAATYQSVMASVQQGQMSMAQVNALNATRASSAMYSPVGSGVLAAGGDAQSISTGQFNDMLQRAGINTDQEYIVGPDGNLHPNPYYAGHQSGATFGAGGGSPVAGVDGLPTAADLNGDGVISAYEAARWSGADARVSSGIPSGFSGSTAGYDGVTGSHGSTVSSAGVGGVRGDVDALNADAYKQSISGHTVAPATSGGVKSQVDALDGNAYKGSLSGPTTSASSTGSGGFIRDTGGPVTSATSTGGSPSTTASYQTDELRMESREWEEIAQVQDTLANDYSAMPMSNNLFGVLDRLQAPYQEVVQASSQTAKERGAESDQTSDSIRDSATEYDLNEVMNTMIAEGITER